MALNNEVKRGLGYFPAQHDGCVNKDLALKHYLIFSPVMAGIFLVAANFCGLFIGINPDATCRKVTIYQCNQFFSGFCFYRFFYF